MKFLLTSSVGTGETILTSFDNALYQSGIANYNLVKISSILPANPILVKHVTIKEGSVLYTAYASLTTKEKKQIAAAVAVGIPQDETKVGVIMEYSGYCNKETAEKMVRTMVEESMAFRGYRIKEILSEAAEAINDGNQYVTVLAALPIWNDVYER